MDVKRRLIPALLTLALMLAGCTDAPDEAGNGAQDRPPGSGDDGGDAPGGAEATDGSDAADGGTGGVDHQPVVLVEDFEQDLDAWERGSDLPGGAEGAWSAKLTGDAARSGQQSLALSTGDAGAGTVWLTRTVDGLTPGAGYVVTMTVWAQAEGASEEALGDVVLYVGHEAPSGDGSFSPEDSGPRHMGVRLPLTATSDWQESTLDWGTPGPEGGTMHVAVGVSTTGETGATYRFDDLQVSFEPQ